jgi:hypothetical protein
MRIESMIYESPLLVLPVEIYTEYVIRFLGARCVSRLDTACASNSSRAKLRELLRNAVIDNQICAHLSPRVIQWLRSRKISLTNVQLWDVLAKPYDDLLSAVTKLDIHPIKQWNADLVEVVHTVPRLYKLDINAAAYNAFRSAHPTLWKPSIAEVVVRKSAEGEAYQDCLNVFQDTVEILPNLSKVSYVQKYSASKDRTFIELTVENGSIVSSVHNTIYEAGDWGKLLALEESTTGTQSGGNSMTGKEARVALRELQARGARSVGHQTIIALAARNPQLRVVSAGAMYCREDTLTALATLCPQLQVLFLGNGEHLTDEAVGNLARGCPDLRELTLHWDEWQERCKFGARGPLLTDAAIIALSQHCPRLQKLDLTRCRLLTDAAEEALAQGCPNLTSVTLTSCALITDAAIAALAQGCRNLHSLYLAGCDLLTDASLITLSVHAPQLRMLSLTVAAEHGAVGISTGVAQTVGDADVRQVGT